MSSPTSYSGMALGRAGQETEQSSGEAGESGGAGEGEEGPWGRRSGRTPRSITLKTACRVESIRDDREGRR